MATNPPPPTGGDPRYPSADPRWAANAAAWKRQQREQERAWRTSQRNAARLQQENARQQARYQREWARNYARGLRTPSVVGPVLLIGLGIAALLLYRGRIQLGPAVDLYARWWPLLLIAVGLLRLGEWLLGSLSHREGAPPVRSVLGGGTVVLLIFLSLLGIAAQGKVEANRHGIYYGRFVEGDFNRIFGSLHAEDDPEITATTGTMLYIENPRGDVEITGDSTDGQLHMRIHKEIYSSSDETAEQQLRALSPQLQTNAQQTTIRVPHLEGGSVRLELSIPPALQVNVHSYRGDVKVNRLAGTATVIADNGDSELNDVDGAVTVRAHYRGRSVEVHRVKAAVSVDGTAGDVNITDVTGPVAITGDFFGDTRVQHVDGRVSFQSSRTTFEVASMPGELTFDDGDLSLTDAAGPLLLNTRDRQITLTRIRGDARVTNSHGKVELATLTPGGTVNIDNRLGDVRLTLPGREKFTVSATTSDGTVQSDFAEVSTAASHGSVSTLVNGGGAAVRITTTHGNIEIDKNSDDATH